MRKSTSLSWRTMCATLALCLVIGFAIKSALGGAYENDAQVVQASMG